MHTWKTLTRYTHRADCPQTTESCDIKIFFTTFAHTTHHHKNLPHVCDAIILRSQFYPLILARCGSLSRIKWELVEERPFVHAQSLCRFSFIHFINHLSALVLDTPIMRNSILLDWISCWIQGNQSILKWNSRLDRMTNNSNYANVSIESTWRRTISVSAKTFNSLETARSFHTNSSLHS